MLEPDLGYVLDWRNHPDIRRFMLTQREITPTEHREWFEHASKDETRALLVIEECGQPLGCVTFSGVKNNSTADWSFYSAPGNPPGTGTRICSTALAYAFTKLNVYKVSGRVLDINRASIRVHLRLGFTQEENLREHCLINGKHHELFYFGMCSRDWLTLNNEMARD